MVVEDRSIGETSFKVLSIEELGIDWLESIVVVIESALEIELAEDVELASVEFYDTSLIEEYVKVRGVEQAFHSWVKGSVQSLEQASIVSSLGSRWGNKGTKVLILVANGSEISRCLGVGEAVTSFSLKEAIESPKRVEIFDKVGLVASQGDGVHVSICGSLRIHQSTAKGKEGEKGDY